MKYSEWAAIEKRKIGVTLGMIRCVSGSRISGSRGHWITRGGSAFFGEILRMDSYGTVTD